MKPDTKLVEIVTNNGSLGGNSNSEINEEGIHSDNQNGLYQNLPGIHTDW